MIKEILGIILVITGIFDSIKYYWFGKKIKEVKSSKSYSRKGMNWAIFHDLFRLIYAYYIKDLYIGFASILALITMVYCWWQIYLYYPYHYRNLKNFKRPNIFIYFINSLLPNQLRKRL